MDGLVPQDAAGSGLRQRRPERGDLQGALGQDTRSLPSLPHLQRLLESLRQRLFRSEAPERRQGDRRDRAHGALEQHPAPAGRADGAENAFVFQGRNMA